MAHHHAHNHEHSRHDRSQGRRSPHRRRLTIVLLLSTVYMAAEVAGGLLTNSLALLADAGHMLSDVAGLALSLGALWIAERPPTARRTFGFHRAEILAALANGATLVAVALFIIYEAYQRIWEPPHVLGAGAAAVAAGGLAVNLLGMAILHAGRRENLNLAGAWLHLLTDALGSVGALAAGTLIWLFGWYWADPVASALIALLVVFSSWRLLQESVSVLMESAPAGIDVKAVRAALLAEPGVVSAHDLHVWTITSGMPALAVHVVVDQNAPPAEMLRRLGNLLGERFGIEHATIQLEPPEFARQHACEGCEAE